MRGKDATYEGQMRGGARIFANLSRYHPDYGLTTQEHAARKAARAAGTERFIDKEQLRAHRKPMADRITGGARR
jgi:hypothetical protein